MILKNMGLKNNLKRIIKENDGIRDIILFGSANRGKENPNDIDILVLFKEKVNKEVEYSVRKKLERYFKGVSISSKTQMGLIEKSFDAREGILFEGRSLISGEYIAENYGFKSFGGFKYGFSGWNNLKKTRFYYALNGRNGGEGIAVKLKCIKISDSFILAPLPNIEKFRDFLESWEIKYKYIPILIPFRLGRKEILEG